MLRDVFRRVIDRPAGYLSESMSVGELVRRAPDRKRP